MSVLNSYAEQIDWLSQALAATYQALTGQDAFMQRGMDLADEGGMVGDDTVSFPTRPAPQFENFSFTPPVVAPALSLEQLSADFSATKIAASTAAAATWKKLSADISSIAQGLHSVSTNLAGGNSGEAIDAAVARISEVAHAGETFAQNSQVMGQSVEQLAAIKAQGATQVNLARASLAAIVDPVQRKAAEQAFLASFPVSFSPSVASGVPPIRNLMSMEGGVDGGGEVALGMSDVDGTGEKHDASGLRPSGVQAVADTLGHLQRVSSAAQFASVDAQTGDLAGVGEVQPLPGSTPQIGDITTGTAGVGASSPSIPAASLPGTGAGGAGLPTGGGVPGVSGVPGASGAAGAPAGAGPVAPLAPIPPVGGRPVIGGTTAVSTNAGISAAGMPAGAGPLPTVPATRGPGPLPPGGVGGLPGGVLAGPRPTPSGSGGSTGAPGLSGTVGGMGAGGVGSAGGGAGVGSRSGMIGGGPVPGAASNPGGVAPGTAGARGGGSAPGPAVARGMVPMMGAPMAGSGQQAKAAKVRTVTSGVEEDANVAALLGERHPVVPGVIGAWVRG